MEELCFKIVKHSLGCEIFKERFYRLTELSIGVQVDFKCSKYFLQVKNQVKSQIFNVNRRRGKTDTTVLVNNLLYTFKHRRRSKSQIIGHLPQRCNFKIIFKHSARWSPILKQLNTKSATSILLSREICGISKLIPVVKVVIQIETNWLTS